MGVIISETQRLNDSTSSEGMTKITFPVAVVVATMYGGNNEHEDTKKKKNLLRSALAHPEIEMRD